MRVTYLSQTGFLAEADGHRLVMDPWLSEGAFEGSWYHYPPVRTRLADLLPVHAAFISHLHGDHCDPLVLDALPRTTPMIVLDREPNFLARMLEQRGFHDIRRVPDGATIQVDRWEITLFAPFSGHSHFETRVGNIIDSSILVRYNGLSFLNFTDNFPTVEAAADLRHRFGAPTLASVPYNGAGDYPACCESLDETQKLAERDRLLARNLDRFAAVVEALSPELVYPCSSEYVLAGRLSDLNRFLMQAPGETAAATLRSSGYRGQIVAMREGMSVDLQTRTVVPGPFPSFPADRVQYGAQLRSIKLPYESDPAVSDDERESVLVPALVEARHHLWARQKKYHFFDETRVYIDLGRSAFGFSWDADDTWIAPQGSYREPYIRFAPDLRLLRRLMNGTAHWDNALTGCHVPFWREPNVYKPDIPVLLSFFHPPPAAPAAQTS